MYCRMLRSACNKRSPIRHRRSFVQPMQFYHPSHHSEFILERKEDKNIKKKNYIYSSDNLNDLRHRFESFIIKNELVATKFVYC